jgi:hypothetical protein
MQVPYRKYAANIPILYSFDDKLENFFAEREGWRGGGIEGSMYSTSTKNKTCDNRAISKFGSLKIVNKSRYRLPLKNDLLIWRDHLKPMACNYRYCTSTVPYLPVLNTSNQCCGSGIFYPGSWFLSIPDPGSRIPDPTTATKEGEKICCPTFFVATKNDPGVKKAQDAESATLRQISNDPW